MLVSDNIKSLTIDLEYQGVLECTSLDEDHRSKYGQFFSPIETAHYLAKSFSDTSFGKEIVLHDPGAGGGILTAAFVDSLIERISRDTVLAPASVTLVAGERDDAFIDPLNEVLERCKDELEGLGITTEILLVQGDWIEHSVEALEDNLLTQSKIPQATHCILNPPYKKLTSSSRQRQLLSRLGIETTNLYSAFVWLAMKHLVPNGELCAITPRSFCNGPYFKPFRHAMLETMQLKRLHLLESRTEAFQRDKVLQENIIYLLKKKNSQHTGATQEKSSKVKIFMGDYASATSKSMALSDVVHPGDPQQFFHIAINALDKKARDYVMGQQATLEELNLTVSTGPVVDFRLKSDLCMESEDKTYPLVYPHLLSNGKVTHPPAKASDLTNTRQQKKPVAIKETDQSSRFLLKRGCYVLVKRFSSKEEKRRVVAAVLYPADFPEEKIGIENHINYYHCNGEGLDEKLAEGLATYLNSPEVDQYFRQFNGHTQVNATDLRSFKYPTADELTKLATKHVTATS